MQYPAVVVIIVNWNGRKYLSKCLNSLTKIVYPANKIRIILIDNGSVDKSLPLVRKLFPQVDIITNSSNLGFAKANNMGISQALQDKQIKYIATLNNDTEVDKDWLKVLVDFMERNPKAGVSVGKILQFKRRKFIDSAGDFISSENYRIINRGYGEKDNGQYDKTCEIFSACAAAAIYRAKSLKDIQLGKEFFDEDFISYIEDVDLSVRLRLRGWRCFYIHNAITYHIGSATSSLVSKEYKEFLSRRNRILMVAKSFPYKYALFLIWYYLLPSKKGMAFYLKTQRYQFPSQSKLSFKEAAIIHCRAIIGAMYLLPKMVKKRLAMQKNKTIEHSQIKYWFDELSINAK